jgi:single-strand DNA-binding protein
MYHRIVLIGHLGAAPDLRYTPSGHAIAHFHLATSDRWTGMDGAVQDRALWWRVSVFGPLAEACHQHLKKGSRVFVEGRLTGARYRRAAPVLPRRYLGRGSVRGQRQPPGQRPLPQPSP